jgi:adenylylsulfate kinase-like enzyme
MLIKIFGGKGEGKSTIAHLIKKELNKAGIKVELEEGEDQDIIKTLDERLEVIKDELKVSVRTINLRQETLPTYTKLKFE